MSIYSTVNITQEDAIGLIEKVNPRYLTDRQLEEILFILYGEQTLHNFSIASAYNKEWGIQFPDVQQEF
jgi:hypothetical protein